MKLFLQMYLNLIRLGVTAQVSNWNTRNDEFSLILESNPLSEFVEVPPELAQDLK